ncbi:hypothetical protein EL18_01523 [Nitratireductor basaltis]|uniref:Uncharacterized protein n=1 Tax=Nitratireductor basaltis TaxID=472175 RepID=A0A084UC02_9HYPH|nr:hypothetical protein EL18_01523 [Nitratireductor basaltis]
MNQKTKCPGRVAAQSRAETLPLSKGNERLTDTMSRTTPASNCSDEDPAIVATRSFTAWKLELIDAITCDKQLAHIDRVVGVRIVQHINRRTREANPSLARIAAQVGISIKTAKRSAARLCHKECRWFARARPSRTAGYVYRVNDAKALHVLDAKAMREDQAKELLRGEKREMWQRLRGDSLVPSRGYVSEHLEGTNGDNCEGTPLSPEHLAKNHLQEHHHSGSEGNGYSLHREAVSNSYAAASRGA